VPLEAVEARRLYRQVADQLRALIDSGEYRVGSRLPTERDLAEQLKVSRPTVREALIALEVEGRVRIRVGSGIYVSEPAAIAPLLPVAAEIEGPFELLRAREFLEGAIAEQAARVATPADIARIDGSLEAMAMVQHPGEASMIHDRAFHVAVAGCLDNAVLVRVVGELFDQRLNPYFAKLAHYFENPGMRRWPSTGRSVMPLPHLIRTRPAWRCASTWRGRRPALRKISERKLRPHPASAQGAVEHLRIRTVRRMPGRLGNKRKL